MSSRSGREIRRAGRTFPRVPGSCAGMRGEEEEGGGRGLMGRPSGSALALKIGTLCKSSEAHVDARPEVSQDAHYHRTHIRLS